MTGALDSGARTRVLQTQPRSEEQATKHEDEAIPARAYDETRDLSGFDEGLSEPVEVRRNVTISVRFSEDEIAALRDQANEAGLRFPH